MDFLDFFNPLRFFGEASYQNFFQWLFSTLFDGWLARVLGFVFLFFAYWFWVRREQLARGLWFLAFAFLMGYGWIIFRFFGVTK